MHSTSTQSSVTTVGENDRAKTLKTVIMPSGTSMISTSLINDPNVLITAFPQLANSVRAYVRIDYRACRNLWTPEQSSFIIGSDLQNMNGPHFGIRSLAQEVEGAIINYAGYIYYPYNYYTYTGDCGNNLYLDSVDYYQ